MPSEVKSLYHSPDPRYGHSGVWGRGRLPGCACFLVRDKSGNPALHALFTDTPFTMLLRENNLGNAYRLGPSRSPKPVPLCSGKEAQCTVGPKQGGTLNETVLPSSNAKHETRAAEETHCADPDSFARCRSFLRRRLLCLLAFAWRPLDDVAAESEPHEYPSCAHFYDPPAMSRAARNSSRCGGH